MKLHLRFRTATVLELGAQALFMNVLAFLVLPENARSAGAYPSLMSATKAAQVFSEFCAVLFIIIAIASVFSRGSQ